MSDDFLSQYTSALKQEHDGSTAVPEATRARVIRTLAERRPRRAKWWTVGVPALVLLGGSTAWAGASGQLTVLVHQARVAFGIVEDAPAQSAPPSKLKKKSEAWAPQVSPQAPQPVQPEPEPEVMSEEVSKQPTPTSAHLGKNKLATQPELTKSVAEDPALAQARALESAALLAYKQGHEAQFAHGNCSQAVAHYSSYIAKYPSDRFVLEARYNRAVCLVELGQMSEARTALRPFARGDFAGYRKAQAQALLDALAESTGTIKQDN